MKSLTRAMAWPKLAALFTVLFLCIAGVLVAQKNPIDQSIAAPAGSGLVLLTEQYDESIHENGKVNGMYNVDWLGQATGVSDYYVKTITKFHQRDSYTYSGAVSNAQESPSREQVAYTISYYYVSAQSENNPNNVWHYYETYVLGKNDVQPRIISYPGIVNEKSYESLQLQYWIDDSNILFQVFENGIPNPRSVYIYHVTEGVFEKLPISDRISSETKLSNDRKRLYYRVTPGDDPINMDFPQGTPVWYSYDLTTKTEHLQLEEPKDLIVKMHNSEEKGFAENAQDFFLVPNANGCTLAGSPTFYLPWTCNKAMCVERDGPQLCPNQCVYNGHDQTVEYVDCSLTTGSTYSGACNSCPEVTCGHTRPAIDFGDGNLWFQTGTPVLASANGQARRYDLYGTAGNLVVIRHPKAGGGYTYSYYMHFSQFAPFLAQQGTWYSVSRGDLIGYEGNTGAPGISAHYHFELKDNEPGQSSSSYYPRFYEYGGCTPRTGYTYFSRNVPTDGSMQNGYDCNAATNISCNTPLTNQTTVGYASRYATYGNGYHSRDMYGPEKLYRLVTNQTSTITVTLSNVVYTTGNDLDVYILKNNTCANLDPLVDIRGTSSGLTATYTNAPAGTYYIVVDGSNGSSGSYTITAQASCAMPNLLNNNTTYTRSGRTFTLNLGLRNNGNANAGSFSTRFYLSTNNQWDVNDVVIRTFTTNSLNAGSTTSSTATVTVTPQMAPAGTYYLFFRIDHAGAVAESNENDNILYWQTPFALAANLVDGNEIATDEQPIEIPEPNPFGTGIDYADSEKDSHDQTASGTVPPSPTTDEPYYIHTIGDLIVINTQNYDDFHYAVYSIDGRELVQSIESSNMATFQTQGPGLYVVVVINTVTGKKQVQKIMIVK